MTPFGRLLVNAPTIGSRALSIKHIGSTSVPGLAAKPIIDIMLVVIDCADDDALAPDLEAAGYVLRTSEPADTEDSPFHGAEAYRVFKGPDTDVNLHVRSHGSGEIEGHRSFRDWLCENPADR